MLWPLRCAWWLATQTVNIIGILMGLLAGFLLMAVGGLLCFGVVTFFIGLPLFLIGFVLVVRSLY
jgi:hypothetical protein